MDELSYGNNEQFAWSRNVFFQPIDGDYDDLLDDLKKRGILSLELSTNYSSSKDRFVRQLQIAVWRSIAPLLYQETVYGLFPRADVDLLAIAKKIAQEATDYSAQIFGTARAKEWEGGHLDDYSFVSPQIVESMASTVSAVILPGREPRLFSCIAEAAQEVKSIAERAGLPLVGKIGPSSLELSASQVAHHVADQTHIKLLQRNRWFAGYGDGDSQISIYTKLYAEDADSEGEHRFIPRYAPHPRFSEEMVLTHLRCLAA